MAMSKALRMVIQIAMLAIGALLTIVQIIIGRPLAPVEQAIGNWRNVVSARQAHHRMQELPNRTACMRLSDPVGQVTDERLVGVLPGVRSLCSKV